MKDRVREAVFNLLGADVAGKLVMDLFAGTGALGFEALSRGATRAIFVERHFPTALSIRQNAKLLGIEARAEVAPADTFAWLKTSQPTTAEPWLVFCSPPYAFYVEREAEMLSLLDALVKRAPPESLFVVECDLTFDTCLLPRSLEWDLRRYPPAVIAISCV